MAIEVALICKYNEQSLPASSQQVVKKKASLYSMVIHYYLYRISCVLITSESNKFMT